MCVAPACTRWVGFADDVWLMVASADSATGVPADLCPVTDELVAGCWRPSPARGARSTRALTSRWRSTWGSRPGDGPRDGAGTCPDVWTVADVVLRKLPQ
jgi:hypothetical protein